MLVADGLLDLLLELLHLCLVAGDSFLLQFLSLGLVLEHLLIPVLIKLSDFLDVGHLDFTLLVLLLADNLVASLFIQLYPHLGESLLGQVRLHVLALFFPLFLVGVQNFPALGVMGTYILIGSRR